jgi:hypothetical protein
VHAGRRRELETVPAARRSDDDSAVASGHERFVRGVRVEACFGGERSGVRVGVPPRHPMSSRLHERRVGRSRLIRVGNRSRAMVTGLEADTRRCEAVGTVADCSAVVDQRRQRLVLPARRSTRSSPGSAGRRGRFRAGRAGRGSMLRRRRSRRGPAARRRPCRSRRARRPVSVMQRACARGSPHRPPVPLPGPRRQPAMLG